MRKVKTSIFKQLCDGKISCNPEVLEAVLEIAVEIAREGREGRRIGTIFTVGDEKEVLARSRTLILDPLLGHPDEVKRVDNPDMRETIKELAQLDGGFVISGDGVVLSATRYFNATSTGLDLPLGLGGRHVAAASISKETKAIAIVVSESSVVRIFKNGSLLAEILPELWLLSKYDIHLKPPYTEKTVQGMAIITKEEA
jgi:DNA integrity scanning protein DisA with diadenylate cyclase activity